MLSSPRLAALSRPFGSFFRSYFWLTGLDESREQLRIGATLLFSLGSVWLEICSTSIFLETFNLSALGWVYGAIALFSVGPRFLAKGLQRLRVPRFTRPRAITQPFSPYTPLLSSLLLASLVLIPLPQNAVLAGISLAAWQTGLIQLWSLFLRQQRTGLGIKSDSSDTRQADPWVTLLGSAIAAAALLCLLPFLVSTSLDLQAGIILACFSILLGAGLSLAAKPNEHNHSSSTLGPTSQASTTRFWGTSSVAQQTIKRSQPRQRSSREHASEDAMESLFGLRLRQASRFWLGVFGIAQGLACLSEIQLLHQWFNLTHTDVSIIHSSDLGDSIAMSLATDLCWLYILIGFGGFVLQSLIDRNIFQRYGAFVNLGILPLSFLALSLLGLLGLVSSNHWTLGILAILYGIWQPTLLSDAQHKLLSLLPEQARQSLADNHHWGRAIAWASCGLMLILLGQGLTSAQLWFLVSAASGLGLCSILLLRSHYVQLLIATVAEGCLPSLPLEGSNGESSRRKTNHLAGYPGPLLTRAIVQAFKASLRSPVQLVQAQQAIQLLARVDLSKAIDVLLPLLPSLPPGLQLASLEVLKRQPDPSHEIALRHLLTPVSAPEVYAATLQHLLRIAPPDSAQSLLTYLKSDVKAPIRAVAAAYMMAQGESNVQRSASLAFVQMLSSDSEVERLTGAEALRDAGDLERLEQYISPLIEDFSPPVRTAVLQAIAQTQTRALYGHLLQALHAPLTQDIARDAIQSMEIEEAVQLLRQHSKQPNLTLETKLRNWETLAYLHRHQSRTDPLGKTPRKTVNLQALDVLALELANTSGNARQHLLKLLLQQPKGEGIQAVRKLFGKTTGLMALLQEELWLLGHLYSGLVDLAPKNLAAKTSEPSPEMRVFRDALVQQQRNVGERVLLLLQFLYPNKAMTRAIGKLRDRHTIPQGLSILDRLLDPEIKPRVIAVFEAQSASKKLAQLKRWVAYEPLPGQQRLRSLLDLNPGLEDWAHACAFHLACQRQWRVTDDQLFDGLNHTNPAVQEAANSYFSEISSGSLDRLLPRA